MSEPYLAEIRLLSFVWAPKGWALCNGQLLPINQNQALFSLLGTVYGGDGRTTFALPDLRGRVPVGAGTGHGIVYPLGQLGGEAAHTLSLSELPAHTHAASVAAAATVTTPTSSSVLAQTGKAAFAPAATTALDPAGVSAVGGAQAHLNLAPSLTLSFVIALQGVFPSPS